MRQGEPQASLRAMRNDHAELWPRPKGVRSAGTPRRRRRGRCEDTEHRASEVQGGAKTQDDYAELRSSRSLRHGLRRATSLFPSGKRRLLGSAASYGSATIQKAPLSPKGSWRRSRLRGWHRVTLRNQPCLKEKRQGWFCFVSIVLPPWRTGRYR